MPRRRRLVHPAGPGQVPCELGPVQRQVPGEVDVLERRRPPAVPGRAGPVAQRRPALGLQQLQLRLPEEAHPLRVARRRAPLERGPGPPDRPVAPRTVPEPRPAPRLPQRQQRHQPVRPQRAGRPQTGLRRPYRLPRPPRVPGQERRVAERVRLQPGVAGQPGRGQRLRVVRAGVVEPPRVVGQPPHGDGQLARARVQPVRGGAPCGGPGVQQFVRRSQRAGGLPVEPVRAAPVVQQPELPYGLFDGAHLRFADPALYGQRDPGGGGRPAEAQGSGGHRGGAARHEHATQHVALLGDVVGVVVGDAGVVAPAGGAGRGAGRGRGFGHDPGAPPPYGLAGREPQVGQGQAGEHVPEDPFVGVVGAADLPGLHAPDVPGVARDLLPDLPGRPADGGRELPGRTRSAQLTEGEVGNCRCRRHDRPLSGAAGVRATRSPGCPGGARTYLL